MDLGHYPMLEKLQQRSVLMETHYTNIQTVLNTLRTAFTTLEIYTQKLGSELAEMQAAIRLHKTELTNLQHIACDKQPAVTESVTFMNNCLHLSDHGLLSPPITPSRNISTKRRRHSSVSFRKDNETVQAKKSMHLTRSMKRGLSESQSDSLDNVDLTFVMLTDNVRVRRRPKAVRFSDSVLDDIPISDIRTPAEELLSSSQARDLILPIPKSTVRPAQTQTKPKPVAQTISDSHPVVYIRLPKRSDRSHTRDRISSGNVLNFAREKTRWDPTSGKRIPAARKSALENSNEL